MARIPDEALEDEELKAAWQGLKPYQEPGTSQASEGAPWQQSLDQFYSQLSKNNPHGIAGLLARNNMQRIPENEGALSAIKDIGAGLGQAAVNLYNAPRRAADYAFGEGTPEQNKYLYNPIETDVLSKINPNANEYDRTLANVAQFAPLSAVPGGSAVMDLGAAAGYGATQDKNPLSGATNSFGGALLGQGIGTAANVLGRTGKAIFGNYEKAAEKSAENYASVIDVPQRAGVKINNKPLSDNLIYNYLEAFPKSSLQAANENTLYTALLNKTKLRTTPKEQQEWIQDLYDLSRQAKKGSVKIPQANGSDLDINLTGSQKNKISKKMTEAGNAATNALVKSLEKNGIPDARRQIERANKFHKEEVLPLREHPVNQGLLAAQLALAGGTAAGLGHGPAGVGTALAELFAIPHYLHQENPIKNIALRLSKLSGGPKNLGSGGAAQELRRIGGISGINNIQDLYNKLIGGQ